MRLQVSTFSEQIPDTCALVCMPVSFILSSRSDLSSQRAQILGETGPRAPSGPALCTPALVRLHWVWPTMWFGWLNWGSWIWRKQRPENSPACVHFSLTPATTITCRASPSGGGGDTHREQRPCKSGQLPRDAQTASDVWESSDQQNGRSRGSEWLLQDTTKIWGSQSPS